MLKFGQYTPIPSYILEYQIFDKIEKTIDISNFRKKYSVKGKGSGGDLQGPTINGIMNNETKLNELGHIITKNDENMGLYIEHFEESVWSK